MRIISCLKINEFVLKHADAETALEVWYDKVKRSDWTNFYDMKKDFDSVDCIGNNRYVFNIKGGQYRLVAIIQIVQK